MSGDSIVQHRDLLVDLTLFRVRSYTSGVVLALTFFPAMAGIPLVLNSSTSSKGWATRPLPPGWA